MTGLDTKTWTDGEAGRAGSERVAGSVGHWHDSANDGVVGVTCHPQSSSTEQLVVIHGIHQKKHRMSQELIRCKIEADILLYRENSEIPASAGLNPHCGVLDSFAPNPIQASPAPNTGQSPQLEIHDQCPEHRAQPPHGRHYLRINTIT
jgi:hypothetical protein